MQFIAARCYAVVRCPSVRPSAMFVYSVEINKHIFKFFHHRIATPFHTKRYGNIPAETAPHPNEGVECSWVG